MSQRSKYVHICKIFTSFLGGGGKIKITATKSLVIEGQISSSGEDGAGEPNTCGSGGGAGGSIVLEADTYVHLIHSHFIACMEEE